MEAERIEAADLPAVRQLSELQARVARLWKRRRDTLQALGFKSYAVYQRSDLWVEIRDRVFRRDRHRCRFCGASAGQVHHDSYGRATLSGETLKRLYSACRQCHALGSLDADGNAREPTAATRYMRAINPPSWFRRQLSRAEILRLEDLRLALGEGEARRVFWREVVAAEPRPEEPKRKRAKRRKASPDPKKWAAECDRQLRDLERRRRTRLGGKINQRARKAARRRARRR